MNRYEMSVFLACAELHGHITGAGPQLSVTVVHRLKDWLAQRLVEWQPSRPVDEKYDEAVRALIVATLQESTPARLKRMGS